MSNFEYKEPKLYTDPENKKWCIRYSIRRKGETNFAPIKDYGRAFFGKSLNTIKDLDERREQFELLRLTVKKNLTDGIDTRNIESIKTYREKVVAKTKTLDNNIPTEVHFDHCLNIFLHQKGYINPQPKQSKSAKTYTGFLKGQFRTFLEKQGLLHDIRKVTRKHLIDFTDYYTQHPDPKIKWCKNTYNNKRSYLGSFFSLLAYRETIAINPVTKLDREKRQETKRFGIFTREELKVLFDYLKESNYFLYVLSTTIYYSFVRGSELERMHVADFRPGIKLIRVNSEDAKAQDNNEAAEVLMVSVLQQVLIDYLEIYPNKPHWYMFGDGDRPSAVPISRRWYEDFGTAVDSLRLKHPDLFNRPNLTYYGLKHSGVTHFIEDHIDKYETTRLLQFVQDQCRHTDFKQTQVYWKRLGFQMKKFDGFKHL